MATEDNKILKYNYGGKSLKVAAVIYVDLEYFLEKNALMSNNLEKSYTEKKTKHTPSAYSIFTSCSFNLIVTRVKIVWKVFCKDLRKHAIKIINYE